MNVRRVPTANPRADQTPTGVWVVTDPDVGDVVVRLCPALERRWRCSHCGTKAAKTKCMHTFTVAIHLAETVLGLTPAPHVAVTERKQPCPA